MCAALGGVLDGITAAVVLGNVFWPSDSRVPVPPKDAIPFELRFCFFNSLSCCLRPTHPRLQPLWMEGTWPPGEAKFLRRGTRKRW